MKRITLHGPTTTEYFVLSAIALLLVGVLWPNSHYAGRSAPQRIMLDRVNGEWVGTVRSPQEHDVSFAGRHGQVRISSGNWRHGTLATTSISRGFVVYLESTNLVTGAMSKHRLASAEDLATLRQQSPEDARAFDVAMEALDRSPIAVVRSGEVLRFVRAEVVPMGYLLNGGFLFAVITLGLGTRSGVVGIREWITSRRHKPGLCPSCGYSLAGLPPDPSPVCPECGTGFGQIVEPGAREAA